MNRRQFVQKSVLAGAALSLSAPLRTRAAFQAEKVVIGVAGLGRGLGICQGLGGVQTADLRYICDVDQQRNAAASSALTSRFPQMKPTAVTDFRRMLDDPSVHAIAIATPNHWHTPMALLALAAGKHVYVEKPCSHNPREGEMLVAAARKYNKLVQHGTQRRTWRGIVEGIEKVKSGAIGKVLFSRGWYTNARGSIGKGKEAPVPERLDYSLWQGPAPERPYRDNLIPYNWHWFWHWGNGELGNNGVHSLDVCRWGLGVDYPTRVTSNGGRYFFDDDQETPDTHVVTFHFGDKMISWEGRSCQPRGIEGSQFGISFHGTEGTIVMDSASHIHYDLKNKEMGKSTGPAGDKEHLENFLSAIRTGGKLNAEIEEGHKSTLLCHLGNIAQRTGRTINLDPQTHRIVGDKEAEALWQREYRAGWEPKV